MLYSVISPATIHVSNRSFWGLTSASIISEHTAHRQMSHLDTQQTRIRFTYICPQTA